MNNLGGRKFVFCLLLTVLSFVLVLVKSLTPREWIDFVTIIGGIYVAGNVGTKLSESIKKNNGKK